MPLRIVRAWYTHNTRNDGGGATHLMAEDDTSNKTLCGIHHPMMTTGEPEEFDPARPEEFTDCKRCQRSAMRRSKETR